MNHLSDAEAKYQILDRCYFRNILGLAIGDRGLDQNTIRLYHKELTKCGLIDRLFGRF